MSKVNDRIKDGFIKAQFDLLFTKVVPVKGGYPDLFLGDLINQELNFKKYPRIGYQRTVNGEVYVWESIEDCRSHEQLTEAIKSHLVWYNMEHPDNNESVFYDNTIDFIAKCEGTILEGWRNNSVRKSLYFDIVEYRRVLDNVVKGSKETIQDDKENYDKSEWDDVFAEQKGFELFLKFDKYFPKNNKPSRWSYILVGLKEMRAGTLSDKGFLKWIMKRYGVTFSDRPQQNAVKSKILDAVIKRIREEG